MQEAEPSLISYLWEAAVMITVAFLSFFTKKTVNKVDNNALDITKQALDLERFKTFVSDTYVKESSLNRVHDRLDDMGNDIKTLLKEGHH